MSLLLRATVTLFLFMQTIPANLQAQELGDSDDFRDIQKLIENQNIEVAFEQIKDIQGGEPRLTAQSQALMGLIYIEL